MRAGISSGSIHLEMKRSGTGALQMQQAVSTLSPQAALALGLKVDAEALSPAVIEAIKRGNVNLNDPAVTLALIKQNAVGSRRHIQRKYAFEGWIHLCALPFDRGQLSSPPASADELMAWPIAI